MQLLQGSQKRSFFEEGNHSPCTLQEEAARDGSLLGQALKIQACLPGTLSEKYPLYPCGAGVVAVLVCLKLLKRSFLADEVHQRPLPRCWHWPRPW